MKIVLYEFPGDGIPEEDEYDVDNESINTPNRSISQIKNPNNKFINDSNLNILLRNNPKIEKINLDKEAKKFYNKSDSNRKSYSFDDTNNNINYNLRKTKGNPNEKYKTNTKNNIDNINNNISTFEKSNKLKDYVENIKNDNNNFNNTNFNISQDDILMEEDILISEINDNLKTPNINSINSNRFLSKSKEFAINNEGSNPLRKNKVKFNNINNNNNNIININNINNISGSSPIRIKNDKDIYNYNSNDNKNNNDHIIKFNSKKSKDSRYEYSILSNNYNCMNSCNTSNEINFNTMKYNNLQNNISNEINEFSDEKNSQLKRKMNSSAELNLNLSRSKSVYDTKMEYKRKNKSNDYIILKDKDRDKDRDNDFNINLRINNSISQKEKFIFNKDDILEFLKFKEMKKNLKMFFEKLKDLIINFTSCINIIDQSYSWIQKRYLTENLKRITRSYKEKKKSM